MLTELQKRAALAIVNVFETSRARGDYGKVTLLAGDTGHLTYGRAQTTLNSGNLYLLVKAYVEDPGAALATELTPYLERLADRDVTLDDDTALHHVLRRAGDDPTMRAAQDAFFDRVYWEPSLRSAANVGVETALGIGVVYDSRIHGSWVAMRNRTIDRFDTPAAIGERDWIRRYLETRRDWLATHSNELLHATVYRMDAFQELIDVGKWALQLPFSVRGVHIDDQVLTAHPDDVPSAEEDPGRLLRLTSPRMVGEDVRAVQDALRDAGLTLEVDGEFGTGTEAAIREFQRAAGLSVDGVVGPATRAALGMDD